MTAPQQIMVNLGNSRKLSLRWRMEDGLSLSVVPAPTEPTRGPQDKVTLRDPEKLRKLVEFFANVAHDLQT